MEITKEVKCDEFIITDGIQFITRTGNASTLEFDNAGIFPEYTVKNTLRHVPKSLRNVKWDIVSLDDFKSGNYKSRFKPLSELVDIKNGIRTNLNSMDLYITELREYLNSLSYHQAVVAREIDQLLHVAETTNLNMYQGWLWYKQVRDARKRLRSIKDDYQATYATISRFGNVKLADTFENEINKAGNRIYSPRIPELLDDVFTTEEGGDLDE